MDKVSVIMGVYNAVEQQLDRAVESILSQTYPELELIMCDDGSTNGIWAVMNQKWGSNTQVKLIQNEKNIGLAATLNHCLQHVTGAFVARQDADDYSYPERLEEQVDFLQRHPEYGWVGTNMVMYDETGIYGSRTMRSNPRKIHFILGTQFAHGTLMIRKEVINAAKGYRVTNITRRGQDYDMFMRLYAMGYKGYNIPNPLYAVLEDRKAYRRRSFSVQINVAKVQWYGFRKMKLPFWSYIFILRTMLIALVPPDWIRILKKWYQTLK